MIVDKERLAIGKGVAVARQYSFYHRLLRKMQKDSFSKRPCPLLRGGGILERALDRVRHRAHDIGGKQRVGMGSENLRNAAYIRRDHRNSRRGRLDHDIRHRIPARRNDQLSLGEAVSRLDVADAAHRLGETELSDLSLESLEF